MKVIEIPVYSCNEKNFRQKFISKYAQKSLKLNNYKVGESYLDHHREILGDQRRFNHNVMKWKYNQIVGYIVVEVNGCDLEIYTYHAIDRSGNIRKKIIYNSLKKLFLTKCNKLKFEIEFS